MLGEIGRNGGPSDRENKIKRHRVRNLVQHRRAAGDWEQQQEDGQDRAVDCTKDGRKRRDLVDPLRPLLRKPRAIAFFRRCGGSKQRGDWTVRERELCTAESVERTDLQAMRKAEERGANEEAGHHQGRRLHKRADEPERGPK